MYALSRGNELPIIFYGLFSISYMYLLSCRESVSLPLILDVGSSTLWEIDKCIEYTGVYCVAVSGIDVIWDVHAFVHCDTKFVLVLYCQ